MQPIPFDLMIESEYKQFQIENAINLALADPISYLKKHIENGFVFSTSGSVVDSTKVLEGIMLRSEEAALYYVNNNEPRKGRTNLFLACASWRSCADILFPTLRRYLDDEIRNQILIHHTDYSVFATEALQCDLDLDETKGILNALAWNPETVQTAVEYIRKHGSDKPWDYILTLSRCAYTSEEWAWALVKEFPKTLVFSGAARWIELATRMNSSIKVEYQVKESCVRYHADIAQKYVNSKDERMVHLAFLSHPQLRQRILRRKDMDDLSYLKHGLKSFYKFQEKLKPDFEGNKGLIQTAS